LAERLDIPPRVIYILDPGNGGLMFADSLSQTSLSETALLANGTNLHREHGIYVLLRIKLAVFGIGKFHSESLPTVAHDIPSTHAANAPHEFGFPWPASRL